ncbi:hypothetical protein [Dyella sp.]|uniref:hypothetical protein n=1 Tax=Dyella sp. TaxID=1869338 RepID=UPI002D77C18B|nr:hypothetical protein [Dyella sp.]HET7330239.1 hypothetical protein [Dyella sp.]
MAKEENHVKYSSNVRSLYLGLAVLTCALIAMLPGISMTAALGATVSILGAIGLFLSVPAAMRLLAARKYAGVALAVLGIPLVTLLAWVLVFSMLNGTQAPTAFAFGICGAILTGLSVRQFVRGSMSAATP